MIQMAALHNNSEVRKTDKGVDVLGVSGSYSSATSRQ